MRDDTRLEPAALQLDAFLPTVEIAHLMLEREVVSAKKEDGGGEAQ